MIWSDAQDASMSDLLAAGLSAGQVGEKLGVSRNAVIGRASRKGISLNHRQPTASPEVLAERRRERNRARMAETRATATRLPRQRVTPKQRADERAEYGQLIAAQTPLTAPNSAPVTLLDAKPDQCRYVLDEHTHGSKTLMCGAPVENGSWCGFHHGKVFQARAA